MLTESYGGKCQNCGYEKMHLRYGSFGYLQFEACPKCGLAIGQNAHEIFIGDKLWKMIIEANENSLKKRNLPLTRKGIFLWMENEDESLRDNFNIFELTKEEIKEAMNNLTDKEIYEERN